MRSKQANLILSITSGLRSGERILIPAGQVRTIGRTIASDIAIEDTFMSGVHFEIENLGDFAELRDRNSRNKTWVNHKPQVNCKIASTDVIRAGKTVFTVQWEALPLVQLEESLQPKDAIEKTFESDEDCNQVSSSPIGSSIVADADDKVVHPCDAKVVQVEVSGIAEAASPYSSPFDSVDASYLPKDDNHLDADVFVPQSPETSPGEFGSPFDESSIINRPRVTKPVSPTLSPSITKPIPIRVVQSGDTDVDIWAIIEMLSKDCDLQVVSHFRKIGLLTPSSLRVLPVFPFLADGWKHLPVIVDASEWLRGADRRVTDRLVRADGLLLVLTNGTEAVALALQELCNHKVAGFSEGNGFLGWCWPSQLQAILNSLSDPAQSELFGEKIEGFLYSSASSWTAYANPDMIPVLARFGFA